MIFEVIATSVRPINAYFTASTQKRSQILQFLKLKNADLYRDLKSYKMFEKLLEAQQKAEEVKKRLENISVTAEVEGGAIKVVALASKAIKSIEIDDNFLAENGKEGLEELLVIAINKALEQAESVSKAEMAAVTQQMLGGMGGLGSIFGRK